MPTILSVGSGYLKVTCLFNPSHVGCGLDIQLENKFLYISLSSPFIIMLLKIAMN